MIYSLYKLLTGENPLALTDGMKPDGLTVTATSKWRSASKKNLLDNYELQEWERGRFDTPKHVLYLLERIIKEVDYKEQ